MKGGWFSDQDDEAIAASVALLEGEKEEKDDTAAGRSVERSVVKQEWGIDHLGFRGASKMSAMLHENRVFHTT